MEADFSGYATKVGLKCSDGRTIMPDAFKHMDGKQVPLVWQHGHGDSDNVLGHAKLVARDDGIYAYGFFNETERGKNAKIIVEHGDVVSLSIHANKLVERAKQVFHGVINEVSLVLAGANPGALIDNVSIQHSDGEFEKLDDEAVIYTGLTLEHEDAPDEEGDEKVEEDNDLEHADEKTVQDVYDSLSKEQQDLVHYMIAAALGDESDGKGAEHSDEEGDESLNHKEGNDDMTHNVFEGKGGSGEGKHELTHDALQGIAADAQSRGSYMEALKHYALQHNINDIEILFPEAKAVTATPEFDKRRTEWVSGVINATKKIPFSRIKNFVADITHEEARARGYIKGNMKKEEFFGVSKRTTTPTTIYKKQKLDRDDVVDVTDFDLVAWLWSEIRLMLDEEIARAILIGDGRPTEDPANPGEPNPDKVKDPMGAPEGSGIRSVLHDHDLYAATITMASDLTPSEMVDTVVENMRFYKGSGNPVLYTTLPNLTKMLLARDGMGRRLYRTKAELASELMVSSIQDVEVMEGEADLFGIIVNLADYSLGTDKGGEIARFDDFDIDFNQYKYLLETRLSGALTKIRSAVVLRIAEAGDTLVEPASPVDNGDNTVSIVDQTGVIYKDSSDGTVLNATGSPYAIPVDGELTVVAEPDSGYYFENNVEDEWTFVYQA